MDKRCAIEDKVLLNFVTRCTKLRWSKGGMFCMNTFEDAHTWGSPRTRALREHPRCGVIPGNRGRRWQEMRCSNSPTKYLSSAPELLSVLGSTVTRKSSSVSLFRKTTRGIAAQRRREGFPLCQQQRQSLDIGCAVFAFDAPKKGSSARNRGNECQ